MATNKCKPMPEFSEDQALYFWSKVKISKENECWEWTGNTNRHGYGVQNNYQVKKILAHRMAYYLHYMEDPGEHLVLHSCDNPKCCNPYHLRIGSPSENMKDMSKKGRSAIGVKNESCTQIPDNEIYLIREMFLNGNYSQKKIAKIWGVSSCHICWIISGRRRWLVPFPNTSTD